MKLAAEKSFVSTRNACKVCTPLGASIAFKGIEGCVPLIHGSQGCATYIRRYLISHYKEPVDIASTNFTEQSAVFGGEENLFTALANVTKSYNPAMIGIATTCLSETIGDDMHSIIAKYEEMHKKGIPELVHVSTPSFMGTHADGFHNTVLALVRKYASHSKTSDSVNIFPGFVSTADLRHIKEIFTDFNIPFTMVPDYSDTLDYEHNGDYERIAAGGTPRLKLTQAGGAKASVEMGYILNQFNPKLPTAAQYLEETFSVPRINVGLPIGIKETDKLFEALESLTGRPIPEKHVRSRGRLVDAYIDGHKYVFGKKAVVYGEEDFVVGMVAFLQEIGIETVLCASGGNSGLLDRTIKEKINPTTPINVHSNYDFEEIASACKVLKPDIIIGNSKGYYIARELQIPILRVGFPIHDRIGGQRIKHLAYEGTQELFDKLVNTLMEYKQDNSPVGYKYM